MAKQEEIGKLLGEKETPALVASLAPLFEKLEAKLELGKVDSEALEVLDKLISEIKTEMGESEQAVKQAKKSSKSSSFVVYHAWRNMWLILRKMRERFVQEIEG